ncbi:hypothetical protein [Erythrobacter sp. THAF29]|uniref:hypothetical protein n=1 Tax=Erythrobacter sp. THAF29 TaxID=2587851 RepID=UPI0012692C3C|nr:hypothetical protein [Erythrobacter sp. THAF29]QFT77247.1 hypothetical protein FIU90_06805 [Erythrobacter sp. THAF29]
MQVHPDIAALRSDRLAQRRIRAAMSGALTAWREADECKALLYDLARYAAGEPLCDCQFLERLMSHNRAATGLISDWLGRMLGVLRTEPLGEVPHLYRCSKGLSSIQLLKSGRAALNLVAYESLECARVPETALFADRESVELVLTGEGCGTFHRRDEATGRIETSQSRWMAGDRIVLSGRQEARQIVSVGGCLLLLQLTREPERPEPSQEFRLSDGTILQSASGDKAASQRLMACAVLGAMDHRPALAAMEARALDPQEDPDVRWEAVRQALALNSGAGMRLLAGLRMDASDPLSGVAGSLERQLFGSHPELSQEAA